MSTTSECYKNLMSKFTLIRLCGMLWKVYDQGGDEFREQNILNQIQRWLDDNSDNDDLLKVNANQTDNDNWTPLHYILIAHPPPSLVDKILQLAPETIKVRTKNGLSQFVR